MIGDSAALWILSATALISGLGLLLQAGPRWTRRAFGGSLLAVAVVAGVLALDLRPLHEHKPVNVSDIHQQGDADPDSFAAGKDVVYFAATGTWMGQAHGEPGPRIYVYDPARDPLSVSPIGSQESTFPLQSEPLDERPRHLAVVPTTPERVLFTVSNRVRIWDQGYRAVTPDPSRLVEIHGIRTNESDAWMVASPEVGKVQIYAIDPSARTFHEVSDTLVAAETVQQFEVSPLPDRVAFVVRSRADSTLYVWSGSGSPTALAVERPRLLRFSGRRLLFAADKDGVPHACRYDWTGGLETISCGDSAQKPELHGLATFGIYECALVTRDGKTSLFQMAKDHLVEKEPFGALIEADELRPRGFVALETDLAFLSGENTFWTVRDGKSDSTRRRGSGVYDEFVVLDLWAFGNRALCAARTKHDIGVELTRWWPDPH